MDSKKAGLLSREELEIIIAERTGALEEANRQLIARAEDREKAEAQLRQAQKMEAVGQLTGGIAHDFNNLLTAIQGNLELIANRATDEKIARQAKNALEAVWRGAKLTSQLLAFSRHQNLALAPVDVNSIIYQMDDLLRRSLGPEVEIITRLDAKIGHATADANQLELAILNLAINARDAMNGGGLLTITTAEEDISGETGLSAGRYIVIRVTDTGSGMPREVMERAMEPFYTTKETGKGTGLGLSQVYGIARQSGGNIRLESIVDQGTSVSIILPIASTRAPGEVPTAVPPKMARGHRETILVIDDDVDVRRYMVESLETLGYQVAEAAHGMAGLEMLDRVVPDLMIVDYAMPGMTGLKVAAEALRKRPDLPVVLSTGYASAPDMTIDFDNLTFLAKPFRIADLSRVITEALARKGTRAIELASYDTPDEPTLFGEKASA